MSKMGKLPHSVGHGRKGDIGYIPAHLSDSISALLIGIANAILIGNIFCTN